MVCVEVGDGYECSSQGEDCGDVVAVTPDGSLAAAKDAVKHVCRLGLKVTDETWDVVWVFDYEDPADVGRLCEEVADGDGVEELRCGEAALDDGWAEGLAHLQRNRGRQGEGEAPGQILVLLKHECLWSLTLRQKIQAWPLHGLPQRIVR